MQLEPCLRLVSGLAVTPCRCAGVKDTSLKASAAARCIDAKSFDSVSSKSTFRRRRRQHAQHMPSTQMSMTKTTPAIVASTQNGNPNKENNSSESWPVSKQSSHRVKVLPLDVSVRLRQVDKHVLIPKGTGYCKINQRIV